MARAGGHSLFFASKLFRAYLQFSGKSPVAKLVFGCQEYSQLMWQQGWKKRGTQLRVAKASRAPWENLGQANPVTLSWRREGGAMLVGTWMMKATCSYAPCCIPTVICCILHLLGWLSVLQPPCPPFLFCCHL